MLLVPSAISAMRTTGLNVLSWAMKLYGPGDEVSVRLGKTTSRNGAPPNTLGAPMLVVPAGLRRPRVVLP